MRRLFSAFPRGAPGIGLLLIRLVAGTALVARAVTALMDGAPMGPAMLYAFSGGLGLLLLAGLWTPIAGALVAGFSFWSAVAQPGDRWDSLVIGVLGVALALLGPGAWSVDARLFGWKRLEIRDPKRPDPPPF